MAFATIKDFFDSGNLFILFLTLSFFFVVEIFFFLEIVAEETSTIIEKQAEITGELVASTASTADLQATKAAIEQDLGVTKLLAKQAKKERREDIYDRAKETFTLPVVVVAGLSILFFILALVRKNLHWPDFVAVFLVAFSFTTELILYFVVLKNIDYVDDITMLARTGEFFSPADIFGIVATV